MPKLRKNTYAMRYVAGQPAERILPPGAFAGVSPVYPAGTPLSSDEKIRVLVWNIFKQQRAEWQSVLKNFGKDAHLVLLQEAQTTPELVRFATSNYLAADQVPALVLPQHPSGVMTLASAHPIYCCPLREREPILRLPKSALVTVYPLPDARFDLVWSHLAVQWCSSLPQALNELYRVARPGGCVAFTTLLESSLPELNQAWKAVDEQPHANRFLSHEQVIHALAGWRYRCAEQTITLNFDDAFSAMRSLKGIGATHLHAGREKKPLTRGQLQRLELAWPQQRGQFPLSYQLFHGIIERD